MNERLYKQMLGVLQGEAETARDVARADLTGDMWSAIAGHLDNARQRMRK